MDPEQADMSEGEWLRAAAKSFSFDFLKDPEEDIYSANAGKPFRDQE
jgi:hypothetical protein